MSIDKHNVVILEEFIKKIRIASKSGQKEIKFQVSELENVVHNLTILTLKILDRDQKTLVEPEPISIVMDGGGFEENR